MTNETKVAFSNALKKMINVKPLEKITISDLAEICGVNRQTFYYHFHDIYELIEWIYTTEAGKAIGDNITVERWPNGIRCLLEYLQENETFVKATCNGVSMEYLQRFLYKVTKRLVRNVVDECADGYSITEDNREFVANFYKYAFVGIVVEWANSGMKDLPASVCSKLEKMIRGNIRNAVVRLSAAEAG